MSLSRAEKSRQVRNASQLDKVNQDSLKSSIQMVKVASGKSSNLKNSSRVNEQELFGALIYEGLGKINKEAQKSFKDSLGGFIDDVSKFDAKNSILRGVKRALKKLIDGKEVVKDAARLLRQFALGKSQLDGDTERLSVKKKDGKSSGTPVRALKNALNKVSKNEKADSVQHFEFKQNNRAEFKKKAKQTDDAGQATSSEAISPPVDHEAEYKIRLKNANQIKSLIEGPVKGYNDDNRFDAVREFFESEAKAHDGTVTDKANQIISMLLDNDPNADSAMKDYMKDVFDIEIEYQVSSKSDLTGQPNNIDEAKVKFEAEFEIRLEKANVIKAFIEGPVEGYSNEERSDKVLEFIRGEMSSLDEKASKKALEVYSKFIDASGGGEQMEEVDALMKQYMSDVFNIEIEFRS